MKKGIFILATAFAVSLCLAEPQLSSWYFGNTDQYARLYESNTEQTANNWVTTWSGGAGTQTLPTYGGIHEVAYTEDWIYIRTTGLGQHIMGPWYLNEADTMDFPNFPANTATTYRIPRTPQAPAGTPQYTTPGAIGYFVDGVCMFDSTDTFSYSTTSGTDATPVNGVAGEGVWNRDAYVNESVTFDAAFAHQAGSQYHYHANAVALRHLLDDHVDYDYTNNIYAEQTDTPLHSPILGWVKDGHPIYGPYGYTDSTNAASTVRRMISGYEKRSMASRQSLPAWAARVQGYTGTGNTNEYTLSSGSYGPAINATYVLGHYLEDYEYLGDLGLEQGIDFDLDEHNGRYCVTPEFPEGVYAYFTSIETDGTPRFPYNIGLSFYGNPTGGTATMDAAAVTYAEGGPEKETTASIEVSGTDVVLLYDGIENGSYRIECITNLLVNSTELLASNVVAAAGDSSYTHTNGLQQAAFYKITLDSVADFDDAGFDSDIPTSGAGGGSGPASPDMGSRGTTVNVTITLDAAAVPPLPPAGVTPNSVTFGTLAATSIVRVDYTTVTATLTIPPGAATGAVDLSVAFTGPPPYIFTDAFTIN